MTIDIVHLDFSKMLAFFHYLFVVKIEKNFFLDDGIMI